MPKLIIPTTDEATNEAFSVYDEENEMHALGNATPAVYRTLGDLLGAVAPEAIVTVGRDWERFVVADVQGDDRFFAFYISERGRIGFGGVNQPVYYDTVSEMLASAEVSA